MKQMSKGYRSIFYIVGLFIFLLAVQVVMFSNFFNELKSDTQVINDFSRVRGSIQRYTKLELSAIKVKSLDVEAYIDSTISSYTKKTPASLERSHVADYYDLDTLNKSWGELKVLVTDYHNNPTQSTKMAIIEKSEECWKAADTYVLRSQYILNKTTAFYKYFILTLALNISAIVLLLYLYKRLIYNRLADSAINDSLTGVFNKGYFTEYLDHEMVRAVRKHLRFSLIMIDIDHFKMVNDTYGHRRGDYTLQKLADILRNTKRNVDVLARIGGEEFIILLPDTDLSGAVSLAEKIRINVQDFAFEEIGSITVSLGVTEFNQADTNESILKRVDSALYKAKERGRNRYEVIGGLE